MSGVQLLRGGRIVAWMVLVVFSFTAWQAMTAAHGQQERSVLVSSIEGDVITPVIADFLEQGVRQAEREGYGAYVVMLDTPGGLDESMRQIIQAFLGSEVPVIVYVAPSGARAASAGALITMAAHVAAMAPGTAIGAATPVAMEGGEISDKVIEDAAAYAEAIAEQRDRNVEFAVATVREGRAVSYAEAAEVGAVDLIAESLTQLLTQIDGTEVTVGRDRDVTLATRDAHMDRHDLGFFPGILQRLANPNLAFLFMSIGTLAIIYELASPGIGVGGIIGAILLILAMFALSVFPVNVAGVLLILLALALFIAELFAPGVGVFAATGTVSLLLGGIFLFRGEDVGVDPVVLLPVVAVVGGGAVLAGRFAWRTRHAPGSTGPHALIGHTGVVRGAEGTSGRVLVDGVWWNVRSTGAKLQEGRTVRVTDMEDLKLVVEPEEEST